MNVPIRIVDTPGISARVTGHLAWQRIEISALAWRSPYRQAILAHEMFHARMFHGTTTLLIIFVACIGCLFCIAAQEWGQLVVELGAFVACMTVWSWWREFAADWAAVRQGWGPDLAHLFSGAFVDSPLTHPTSRIRVNYLNWLTARHG